MRTLILCILLFISYSSGVLAQSYRCELRENGYAAAFSSMNANASRKTILEFFESWSPNIFIVNAEKLIFSRSWQLDISGGDREKSFQARYSSGTFHVAYNIKIDTYSGTGNLYLTPTGPSSNYKRMGPMRYSCTSMGGSSYKQSSVSNNFRQEFSKLTSCNKRYVQQFLKGQNLYNGAIDGLWGSGTGEGLRRAKNLSAFRNLTTAKMFEKLRLNPICN